MEILDTNLQNIGSLVVQYAVPALLAILCFIVGRWLSNKLGRRSEQILNKAPNADPSVSRFFASIVKYALLLVTIMASLSLLGVDTTAVSGMVLGLGAAMAFILKDSLADLAAGVMMMIFRPFKVGDEVEINGTRGVVLSVELTATRMKTRQNVELIVGNGKAWGGVIRNHTALGNRRLDMVFGVSYDADIDKAIEVIKSVAMADARVHRDPEPWAKVVNLGDSSVDIELRVWCTSNDIRNIKVEISQPIKAALDKANIGIPYPHEIKIRQKVKKSKARDRIAKLNKLKNT